MKDLDPKRAKARARQKKWLIGGLLGLVLLGALGAFAKYSYPRLNAERLLSKARAFHARKDYHSAAISAQRVLQLDERNVAAVRILLQITDELKSPGVLFWKHRLALVEPDVLENHLAVAEEALDQRQWAVAEKALAEARERGGTGRARYHALSGRAAVAAKNTPRAETEFAEAARLEPANGKYQLQWQIGRLRSNDPEIKKQARAGLEPLLERPEVFAQTSRVLIADALERREANRALKLAIELHKTPVATFGDHLVYLDVLHRLKRPEYAAYLTHLQDKALQDLEHVYALILWLNDHHSALLAIDWAKRLPPEISAAMPVPVAVAQCYARLKDWEGLKPLVSEDLIAGSTAEPAIATEEKWGDFEFMRLAFSAAVRRAEGDLQQGRSHWLAATKSAANRMTAVTSLARFAVDWGWENESTDLLWKVAQEPPDAMWALDTLYRRYELAHSASNLRQVTKRILEIQPANPDMRNNLAMLDLLLGTNVAEAVISARDLHQREPQNSSYLTTYSFGLFLQGFVPPATELIKKLPDERRRLPSAAVYCGIILSASEAREEARGYLELAKDANLLPEERKLVAQAWERLAKPAQAENAPPAPAPAP